MEAKIIRLSASRVNMTHINEKSVKTFSPLGARIRAEGRIIVLR